LAPGGGLSSYPHPYLMPEFWQFPTVSMGLGPIVSIYQAQFDRYLRARGLVNGPERKVWCFVGDGEVDEPETLGSLTLASREKLDNLIFVINCNLQRLDGPVRGNGKIIQELEAVFRGAGWHVIKVIWGNDWDPLLAQDTDGLLLRRMEEAVDGDYQNYAVRSGDYTRSHFFGKYPQLLRMVEHLTDDQIKKLRRGGHDPEKVYAAYREAVEHTGSPTVILAKTIKGYGLGEAGEGRNITHQQKKLNEEELKIFRDRFDIPIPEEQIDETPFYRPPEGSEETQYLLRRRQALGGFLPQRMVRAKPLEAPDDLLRLKLFQSGVPLSLSDVLPLLENMGVRVDDQRPYEVRGRDHEPVWIYDFGLHPEDGSLETETVKDIFADAFTATWWGERHPCGKSCTCFTCAPLVSMRETRERTTWQPACIARSSRSPFRTSRE